MVWESQYPDANGQIHFGDAPRKDVPWIASLASSLRWEPPTEKPIDAVTKTDAEILSMISIDPGQDESN